MKVAPTQSQICPRPGPQPHWRGRRKERRRQTPRGWGDDRKGYLRTMTRRQTRIKAQPLQGARVRPVTGNRRWGQTLRLIPPRLPPPLPPPERALPLPSSPIVCRPSTPQAHLTSHHAQLPPQLPTPPPSFRKNAQGMRPLPLETRCERCRAAAPRPSRPSPPRVCSLLMLFLQLLSLLLLLPPLLPLPLRPMQLSRKTNPHHRRQRTRTVSTTTPALELLHLHLQTRNRKLYRR